MYVLIDYDRMQVLAKHPNFQRLHEYGILCCSESSVVLPLEVEELYKEFDDVQMQLLYINLTGNKQGALYPKKMISKIIHYFLNEIPETVIDADVAEQADWAIASNKEGECMYCEGSSVPDLGEEPNIQVRNDSSLESAIIDGPTVQTNMGIQGAWTPTRERQGGSIPANEKRAATSRTAGTRDIIFAVADEMWKEAGEPRDKKEILQLRKQMMDRLEAQGVKRNTSSNTLGVWVKERGLN